MDYSEYRRIARANLADNWTTSVLVTLVAALLGGVVNGANFSFNLNMDAETLLRLPDFLAIFLSLMASIGSIIGIVQFVIGGTVQIGHAQYLLKQYRKEDYGINDLFSQFYRLTQGFLQAFLRGLFVFLWSLLLIVPGIIKSLSYAMTPFIMADHPELTAREAMDQSQILMDGHKADLFVLELTFLGWGLLCALTLGIGFLWLNPYINATYAVFYQTILHQNRLNEASY